MAVQRAGKERVASIDALRGLVMIIMALDHVRDFTSVVATQFQPDNLARTTAALFFTRWITHFCAPVFCFTAGVGAYFWLQRGRTTGQLSRFLLTRGLWLILLEFTVIRLALDLKYSGPWMLIVFWSLGMGMIVLAALAHLPMRAIAAISIAAIVLHNLADKVKPVQFGTFAGLWDVLHEQALFHVGSVPVLSAYPLVPWIFVMSAGFCYGPMVRRREWTLRLGIAVTAAFLLIRWLNIYGDPSPWTVQKNALWTVLSFLRCTKQPPSLDFLLMTLGPALFVLAWFDRLSFARSNPLIVFGRVPMLYFVVHLYVAHAIGALLGARFSLGAVYGWWALVVITLYPFCLWFSRVKERNKAWWLSYL